MKKIYLTLVLLAVAFATSFSQTNNIAGTQFVLFDVVNGVGYDTGFIATAAFDYPDAPDAGGYVTIVFNRPTNFKGVDHNNVISVENLKTYGSPNGAVICLTFHTSGFQDGNALVKYKDTTFTFITAEDTVEAYNNGYNAGLASVDTATIWNNGYTVGYDEGYDKGYDDGVESVTGTKSLYVTAASVYPNPASTSDQITVDYKDFNNVQVVTLAGKVIYTSYEKTFYVGDFTSIPGIYVLKIEDNNMNVKNVKLVVK